MRHPINCAVVTLSTGVDATFTHCEADQFDRSGDLTITDRTTFAEHILPAGSWTAYVVYDTHGYYRYGCDLAVRVRIIQLSQPLAAQRVQPLGDSL